MHEISIIRDTSCSLIISIASENNSVNVIFTNIYRFNDKYQQYTSGCCHPEDIITEKFPCSSNNKLETLDNDTLQKLLQECATSSKVVTRFPVRKHRVAKGIEDAEQDIAQTQRGEILHEIRSIAETQENY